MIRLRGIAVEVGVALLLHSTVCAAASRVLYAAPQSDCDGYPRLDIGMADGMCAGLVVGPTQGDTERRMALPRSLLQLDGDRWLVSDLGGWGTERGAIWLWQSESDEAPNLAPLLTGLNLPHALDIGPDGLVYVGEMGRIIRFDPAAKVPQQTIEVVVANLPDNRLHEHRHPLSSFVFAEDGALLVNVGAASDQCLDADGRPSGATCEEAESGEQTGSIRRYARLGPGAWSSEYTVHARGLRNSVALAVHASGTVLQAENSYDFASRWAPFDEINRIQTDQHYGWPYCAGVDVPTPGWKHTGAMDCASSAHTPPVALLPPHAAPLDMLWYHGPMFPELEGRLLMSWHGYRSIGGRIVAFDTDAAGVPIPHPRARFPVYGQSPRAYGVGPASAARVLTPEWDKVQGRRPQGSPVGLAVARDGAIWTTDDRAGLVIRIAKDAPQDTSSTVSSSVK